MLKKGILLFAAVSMTAVLFTGCNTNKEAVTSHHNPGLISDHTSYVSDHVTSDLYSEYVSEEVTTHLVSE